MLMYAFVRSHFVENPQVGSWETNPYFFGRGSVTYPAVKPVTIPATSPFIPHCTGKPQTIPKM
jgi:hypothetical protein